MAYLGENIPKLGFGLMRLPTLDENTVDIEQTKQMVDKFLDAGFTYFDTAYGYLKGNSEKAVKTALVDRYPRESFQLATKLPAWAGPKSEEEAKQMFYTSLERTGAGYFDFYLLHNLGDNRTEFFEKWHMWDYVKDLKEKGLVKHVGFSFHDKAEVLEDILSKHAKDVEFIQLQINYADYDTDTVQCRKCLAVAEKYNLPVVVMEPIKGGLLANPPETISRVFTESGYDRSPSEWALYFAASQKNIITVLSGMSTVEQMEQNLESMKKFSPLDEAEMKVIDKVTAAINSINIVPCTSCEYCMKGCPMEIAIPKIFSNYNDYLIYQNLDNAKGGYKWATGKSGKACDCVECGQCESVCPQHIDIINQLKKASELFD